nr:uncharacterized protein LOC27208635 isoform X2 [Drosophila simulans]
MCKDTTAPSFRMHVGIGRRVGTERPFQKLCNDFLDFPEGDEGATAANVVDFMANEVFYKLGVPETVHLDNGKQFTSKTLEEMVDGIGSQHIKTPKYSPQSNAAVRVNRNVLAAILDKDHREWDAHLPEIEVAIWNTAHSATGKTPFFTVFGHHMFLNKGRISSSTGHPRQCPGTLRGRLGTTRKSSGGTSCRVVSEKPSTPSSPVSTLEVTDRQP